MEFFHLGHAAVKLAQAAGDSKPALSYSLKGRLILSDSGWVLLEVPNDIGNGAFKALDEPGIEQPLQDSSGKYNAHISVIRPEEIEEIGGVDKLTQRGKMFSFNLGPVRSVKPAGWTEMSKCWFIEVNSPELMAYRRSLGLGEPKYKFHITFAVRRKQQRKTASLIYSIPEKYAASQVEIKESPIHGKGLFATVAFEDNAVIVPQFMTRYDEEDKTRWEQSSEARYTNDSNSPNAEVVPTDGYAELRSTRSITKGEEILVSYVRTTSRLGNDFYYTYRGKPYGADKTNSPCGNQRDLLSIASGSTTNKCLTGGGLPTAQGTNKCASIRKGRIYSGPGPSSILDEPCEEMAEASARSASPGSDKGSQKEKKANQTEAYQEAIIAEGNALASQLFKKAEQSFYMDAIKQVPVQWNTQQGIVSNLSQHLQKIKTRGDRAINEAYMFERLQNAANPSRGLTQLSAYLAGQRRPTVSHPLDQFIQGTG